MMLALLWVVPLSLIAGAVAVSVFMLALHQPLPHQLFVLADGLDVILRHRSNIERLIAGTEPRLGQKLP